MKHKSIFFMTSCSLLTGSLVGFCSPNQHMDQGNGKGDETSWVRIGKTELVVSGEEDPTKVIQIHSYCWSKKVQHASLYPIDEYVANTYTDTTYDDYIDYVGTHPAYAWTNRVNHHETSNHYGRSIQKFGIKFIPIVSKGSVEVMNKRFNFYYKPFASATINVSVYDAVYHNLDLMALATGNLTYGLPTGGYQNVLTDDNFRAYETRSPSGFSLNLNPFDLGIGGKLSIGAGVGYTINKVGTQEDKFDPSNVSDKTPTFNIPYKASENQPEEWTVPIAGQVTTTIHNTLRSSASAEARMYWGLSPDQPHQQDQWKGGPDRSYNAFAFGTPPP